MLGNEAIAWGAIAAGVDVAAGYPGTPSSEALQTLINLAGEYGHYVEWSANEKVAVECAAGAAVAGLRTMAVMKHLGLNVAADALATLAYTGVRGGMVIFSAGDALPFRSFFGTVFGAAHVCSTLLFYFFCAGLAFLLICAEWDPYESSSIF